MDTDFLHSLHALPSLAQPGNLVAQCILLAISPFWTTTLLLLVILPLRASRAHNKRRKFWSQKILPLVVKRLSLWKDLRHLIHQKYISTPRLEEYHFLFSIFGEPYVTLGFACLSHLKWTHFYCNDFILTSSCWKV